MHPYRLKAPCADCPFRTDVEPYIRPERAQEIAATLREGSDFLCHKTVDYRGEDDDGNSVPERTRNTQFCAGALITMENEGYSNQQVRIAERLGIYDPERLDMSAPVHPSLTAWVRSYSPVQSVTVEFNGIVEVLPYEHCGYVGPDCEDPAGYSHGGGVAENDDDPTCHPLDDACSFCGTLLCAACKTTGEDDLVACPACAGEEDG